MNVRTRYFLLLPVLVLVLTATASAQTIIMKDGKKIAARGLRRQGNVIMATIERTGSEEVVGAKITGEIGYSISQIAKIEFPKPAQLTTAPYLILQGKPAEALAQIEPVMRYYDGFLDAPGSWWAETALLKVQALVAMGNRKDAEPLIDLVARKATDPETLLAVKVYVGSTLARKGDHAKSIEMQDEVLAGATNPVTLATAAVFKGESHLALKQYDDAVLAFLQIPVFYPEEKLLVPQALLGVGKAFFALEDFPRARESLNQIITSYASAPQAKEAQAELVKIARREKALADPAP